VTIIIADDDKVVSHLMCSLLRDRGYTVVATYDSMQTLMIAMRQPPPDLILLDIQMPAGTGLQALGKLKSSIKTAYIPVVIITGSDEPGIEERVQALGAVGFLAKPIEPEKFLRVVRTALGEANDEPAANEPSSSQ
jgi:CheY-like chemotaxis protein